VGSSLGGLWFHRWPLHVSLRKGALALVNVNTVSDRIFSSRLGDLTLVKSLEGRCNDNEMTFSVGKTAAHLRVVKFDAEKALVPLSRRLAYSQPTFLLKDLTADGAHHFLDGPDRPAIIHFGEPFSSDSFPTELSVDQKAQEFIELMLKHHKKDNATIEETGAILREHFSELQREFQRTTGATARDFPIPIRVTASSLWNDPGIRSNSFCYWVWTEMPEEHLLLKRFPQYAAQKRNEKQKQADDLYQRAIVRNSRYARLALGPILLACGLIGGLLMFKYRPEEPLLELVEEVQPKPRKRPPKPRLEELDIDL
jgi:hypothetical protein